MGKLIVPDKLVIPQKTYLLATAKISELEPELSVSKKTLSEVGKMPVVPELENQKDLTKLVAILLSTGINRNDDVFLPEEVLPVRNTGAHKPVNLEHDPTQIIGHMIRTFATDKNGKRIPDNKKPKDSRFDITAESVIYKFLFSNLEREIKERADSNELFVSVEVWFTAFDFLVGSKIVKRTSETASVLEPKLKINGGTGNFEGQRLGRVLRNMIIGGIAIVRDPANPESIIKSVSNFNSEVVINIEDDVIASNVIDSLENSSSRSSEDIENQEVTVMEVNMNPEVIEEMAALAAAIKAKAEKVDDSSEILQIPEEQQDNELLQKIVASVNDRLTVIEEKNRETERKLAESEYKEEASRRAQVLCDSGIPSEHVDFQLVTCFDMNKAQFDEYVSSLSGMIKDVLDKAKASDDTNTVETKTDEVAEGGDSAQITDAATTEVTTEEPVVKEETSVDAQDAAAPEASAEVETEQTTDEAVTTEEGQVEVVDTTQDITDNVVEDIEVDIETVDPALNIETDNSGTEKSLTDKMAEIAATFLKRNNPKWENLVKK